MSKISSALNKITDLTSGIYRKFNSAIIVAAGSGTRAADSSGTTKQMVSLMGIPVIVRTVSEFEKCKFINEIIIVAKEDEVRRYEAFRAKYGWKKVTSIVKGGSSRSESVLEGFKKISDKSDFVYIHDGARCLVTEKMIADVGHAACMHGAAFAATKATDTVRVSENGELRSLDRDSVWLAQTPQVFMTEMYRASAYYALQNGVTATDDVMLAEYAGFKPVPVNCGTQNIKITHPCDFSIAEAIINYRNSGNGEKI